VNGVSWCSSVTEFLDLLSRWERDGTWLKIPQALQAIADNAGCIDWSGAALDSTHILLTAVLSEQETNF